MRQRSAKASTETEERAHACNSLIDFHMNGPCKLDFAGSLTPTSVCVADTSKHRVPRFPSTQVTPSTTANTNNSVMDIGTPVIPDDPPTSPTIVNMGELPIAGITTSDQYWNNTSCRPCHVRTTSRQNHDALGNQAIFACRQPQDKINYMQVPSGRKKAAIDNYERIAREDHDRRQRLFAKAFKSGLEEDHLMMTLQSGGNDRSTLGLHPVKDVRGFVNDRMYLEDVR